MSRTGQPVDVLSSGILMFVCQGEYQAAGAQSKAAFQSVRGICYCILPPFLLFLLKLGFVLVRAFCLEGTGKLRSLQ